MLNPEKADKPWQRWMSYANQLLNLTTSPTMLTKILSHWGKTQMEEWWRLSTVKQGSTVGVSIIYALSAGSTSSNSVETTWTPAYSCTEMTSSKPIKWLETVFSECCLVLRLLDLKNKFWQNRVLYSNPFKPGPKFKPRRPMHSQWSNSTPNPFQLDKHKLMKLVLIWTTTIQVHLVRDASEKPQLWLSLMPQVTRLQLW